MGPQWQAIAEGCTCIDDQIQESVERFWNEVGEKMQFSVVDNIASIRTYDKYNQELTSLEFENGKLRHIKFKGPHSLDCINTIGKDLGPEYNIFDMEKVGGNPLFVGHKSLDPCLDKQGNICFKNYSQHGDNALVYTNQSVDDYFYLQNIGEDYMDQLLGLMQRNNLTIPGHDTKQEDVRYSIRYNDGRTQPLIVLTEGYDKTLIPEDWKAWEDKAIAHHDKEEAAKEAQSEIEFNKLVARCKAGNYKGMTAGELLDLTDAGYIVQSIHSIGGYVTLVNKWGVKRRVHMNNWGLIE